MLKPIVLFLSLSLCSFAMDANPSYDELENPQTGVEEIQETPVSWRGNRKIMSLLEKSLTTSKPKSFHSKFMMASYNPDTVHEETMAFLKEYALESLNSYLNSNPPTCSALWDFDQFEISYKSADNISKKLSGKYPKLRRYFTSLQFEVREITGEDPDAYVRSEYKKVKRKAKSMGCF